MTTYGVFLLIHIVSGTVCLLAGAVAMFSKKQKGQHTILGEIYHGSYVFVLISAMVTSIMHWEESGFLLFIALFSYGFALQGYLARKIQWKNWFPSHIGGMIGSYIGIVTAVLVVNVTNIPVINLMPSLIFWFLPSVIGVPVIFMVTRSVTSRGLSSKEAEKIE